MKNLIKLMLSLGITTVSAQSLISCSVNEFDNVYNSANKIPAIKNPDDEILVPIHTDEIPKNEDSLIISSELLNKTSDQMVKIKKFDYHADQKIVTDELISSLLRIDEQIGNGFDPNSENYQKVFANKILANPTVYDLYLTDQINSKVVHLQVNLEIYSAADVIDENVLKFVFSIPDTSAEMNDNVINKFGWEKYLKSVYENWYDSQTSHVLNMKEDHVTDDMVINLNVAWKKFLTEAFFTRVNEDLYYKQSQMHVKTGSYEAANGGTIYTHDIDWSTMKKDRMNLHNYSVTQLLDSVKVEKDDLIKPDGTILGNFTFYCSNGYDFLQFFLKLSNTKTKMIEGFAFSYKMDASIKWIEDTLGYDWVKVYSGPWSTGVNENGDYNSYFGPLQVIF